MAQRRTIGATLMMLVLSCAAFFAACTGDNAQALLETAQFEERQLNRAHAKELYEEVIRRYPASPEAQTAKDRLAALSRD